MATEALPSNEEQLNLQTLQAMAGMQVEQASDDEYISDEEFQKMLTDQEKTIFNALVISINQTHMQRQKNFQKRRQRYLERMG
jgi:hypothetical protein